MYLPTRSKRAKKLFSFRHEEFCRMWREARQATDVKISCQDLRFWFSSEMGRLCVPDRYVDAFCGRTPRSILARHYTDYSSEKLKEIYEKANLKVLS
jgi:intergrase/recombinase